TGHAAEWRPPGRQLGEAEDARDVGDRPIRPQRTSGRGTTHLSIEYDDERNSQLSERQNPASHPSDDVLNPWPVARLGKLQHSAVRISQALQTWDEYECLRPRRAGCRVDQLRELVDSRHTHGDHTVAQIVDPAPLQLCPGTRLPIATGRGDGIERDHVITRDLQDTALWVEATVLPRPREQPRLCVVRARDQCGNQIRA